MEQERIEIDGGATGLVLGVDDGGCLRQLGLGSPAGRQPNAAFPLALYPLVLPTHGEEALREPGLRIVHGDGAPSTRLVVEGHERSAHEDGKTHRIVLRDRVAPVEVSLHWRTWPDHGLVEQWLEVANHGDEPLRLERFASATPALPAPGAHLTHWAGGWANEWRPVTEPVQRGTKAVASAGGVRSSLHLAPLVLWSPGGAPEEEAGDVLAATLVWGGDVQVRAERTVHDQGRLLIGVHERGAERIVDPGSSFATPPAVLAWSDRGVGPISRRLHRWIREHVVRDGHRPRAIAFNNWEAMGFALDTEAVGEVIDGAAEVGAELFLLDDGWFGTSHPRDDDTQGLGDWEVDRAKFPDGLGPVVERAVERGLRFGLWVEPEMVNAGSTLYDEHPDWVIAEPGRERREERQQLVLDLCRPEVADHVVRTIDEVLALHPEISYLKWDANRDVFEAGSEALAPDRQSHLAVDRVRATLAVMDEVARRHPDVDLMLCASGGGRSDLAHLARFHELWTSDNTDPVDRVRLQWGASHLLPALVLGAHVTRWGAKPVAFGCAVAMSARFGFDLDPRGLTDDERTACVQAVETYRQIRPLVQFGDLHRLVSPVGSPRGALAFLAPEAAAAADRDQPCAVAFAHLLEPDDAPAAPPLTVPGLDPERRYVVVDATPGDPARGTTRQVLGRDLAGPASGLGWPEASAQAAKVWTIWPEG